jgi:hypothetical protein
MDARPAAEAAGTAHLVFFTVGLAALTAGSHLDADAGAIDRSGATALLGSTGHPLRA